MGLLEWIGAALAAIVAAMLVGRRHGKQAAKAKEVQDYDDTRKRMDEVGRMSDADASREWLRDRGKP